jgi:hypothetical protein
MPVRCAREDLQLAQERKPVNASSAGATVGIGAGAQRDAEAMPLVTMLLSGSPTTAG